MKKRKYLCPAEVEEIYGLDARTLANWRSQKRGPSYIKVGRLVKYVVTDLEVYFEKCRIMTSDQPEKPSPDH